MSDAADEGNAAADRLNWRANNLAMSLGTADDIAIVLTERWEALAVVAAVKALHVKAQHDSFGNVECAGCFGEWPCATARILEETA